MRYLADFRARTGRKLTVSHMMAKVAAMVLKEVPDANAVLRWNRIYLHKRIGIFFQVVMTDEEGRRQPSRPPRGCAAHQPRRGSPTSRWRAGARPGDTRRGARGGVRAVLGFAGLAC